MLLALAILGLCHANSLEQRQSNWTVGQTVQTSSGPVNGHAASNATQVSEYLGIPYAAPPIGDLRFAAPQNYSGSSTVNGTSFVCCIQYKDSKRADPMYRDSPVPQLHNHPAP